MTNEQILEKAIEKAVKGGYYGIRDMEEETLSALVGTKQYCIIIFNHDFAKAFWGEGDITICCNRPRIEGKHTMICEGCRNAKYDFDCEIAWMVHIQQMVLEKEPLLYLRRFLEEGD